MASACEGKANRELNRKCSYKRFTGGALFSDKTCFKSISDWPQIKLVYKKEN